MARVLATGRRSRNREEKLAITLWGRDTSSNVQKVRWALAELGLEHEHVQLGGKYGGNRTPEYLELNPNGLVPTLRDGDLVLWESHAIVRYLAGRYGPGKLWPADPVARAEVDRWTDWTATTFQPAWSDVFWRFYRTAPEQRDPAAIATAVEKSEACFAIMDAQLERTRFLAGDDLTYAELVAGIPMFRWTTMGLAGLKSFANIARWHRDLHARKAYREMVEVDYSDLAGRTAA
jgi:glutathione S-transferase